MTHASWNNERGRPSGPGHDNERLEYLGDAVLELVVGEYLFRRFPGYDEGQLTQLRAALVNTLSLARLAERLQLGDALLLGKGAAKTGASQLPRLLANCFEALIGAIFLDHGYRVATRVFLQNIGDLADWTDENHKGRLQEAAQERTGQPPQYRVSPVGGPGHRRLYSADAVVGGEVLGTGTGATKQAAEQAAARAAVEALAQTKGRRRSTATAAANTRAAGSRAAAAAQRAAAGAAGEPVRTRRRIAEAAAEQTMSEESAVRRPAAATPPAAASATPVPAQRGRGFLKVLRSAAEAIVGRAPAVPAPAPAPPPLAPAPPPAAAAGPVSKPGATGTAGREAPARSRRGRRGGRGRRRTPGEAAGTEATTPAARAATSTAARASQAPRRRPPRTPPAGEGAEQP